MHRQSRRFDFRLKSVVNWLFQTKAKTHPRTDEGNAMLCPNHSDNARIVSRAIGRCSLCLESDKSVLEAAVRKHESLRESEGLVPAIPAAGAIVCPDCGNHCRLYEGNIGYCNLRVAKEGKVEHRFGRKAVVSWYFDPLPTNCVADWVCPVTKRDPAFHYSRRLNNLAVFYGSCNSDCLFCQNTSYREMMARGSPLMTAEELASVANDRTACVCYFGGDPACNPEHSLETSRLLYQSRRVKVCYETNGNISTKWLGPIADIVKESGGTLKFDLKAVTPQIYKGLTGVSNKAVLANFEKLAKIGRERESEFLVVSILLVPGYIGISELRVLAQFIASQDPTIPTAMLGFSPHHAMSDLPRTSRAHAETAKTVAIEAGLTNVRIGNVGLLSSANYTYE
ncbi:MAG: radical SAM protein [Candidatus Thorarchaeota archaeon]|nr:MAG: radical SAM protein [Candidatus Thorarchaeota archaeon]